jgi:hypothetical protein
MIWILLLYVLPLIISLAGAYYFIKQDEGTTKDLLEILPYLFIPLANIILVVMGIISVIGDWLDNDDNWQNFLNKKL